MIKRILHILGGLQKYETKLYSTFSFWLLFFEVKWRNLQIFNLNFFDNENFAARARGKSCRFSGIELIKIYQIGSNVPNFKNPQKIQIPPP